MLERTWNVLGTYSERTRNVFGTCCERSCQVEGAGGQEKRGEENKEESNTELCIGSRERTWERTSSASYFLLKKHVEEHN